jgi:hypothetical protein
MKDLKFRVKNPQHSEAIQKRLFELGCEWRKHGSVLRKTDRPALFAYRDGAITFLDSIGPYFNEHLNTEANLDDLYSPEFINEDTSNEDTFKQAFPELCRIADEMIDVLNKLKTK